ncbi:MAG: hypothetical protein QXO68_01080 [Conexivisphaerales archaeon]
MGCYTCRSTDSWVRNSHDDLYNYNIYEDKGNTEGDKAMSHPWKSRGDKRTIVGYYEPQEEVMKYLTDMQSVIRYAIEVAYEMAIHIAIGYLHQLH